MTYIISDVRVLAAFFASGVLTGIVSAAIRLSGGLF